VFLLTTSAFVGMTMFALMTMREVDPMFILHGMMWGMVWCTITMFVSMFFIASPMMLMIYSLCGAMVALVYVAIDTMLIFGGQKYGIDQDDYIKASLMIYLDVVQLFLHLLALFGERK
jgi:hypothetical protein